MKYKKEILLFIFLLTALALLLINSLNLPHESYALRALIDVWALVIFPVVGAVYAYRKSRLLSYSFIAWSVGALLWKIWNVKGTLLRPFISELFFTLFFVLFVVYLFKEAKLKTVSDYVVIALLLISAYFAFVFSQKLSLLSFYGIMAGLLASFGLISFLRKSESFNLGIFLFGAAETVYIYAIQANGYYISGWVDFMYLLSWFVIMFGLMERKN